MTDTLPDRWASRDLPVLLHIVDAVDRGDDIDNNTISAATDLDGAAVVAAVENLERGGYLEPSWMMGPNFSITQITERALRETGIWPNAETQADHLLWVLEQKVESASTPDERSKWQRLRDAVVSGGRDFTVELAAAMAARSMGA